MRVIPIVMRYPSLAGPMACPRQWVSSHPASWRFSAIRPGFESPWPCQTRIGCFLSALLPDGLDEFLGFFVRHRRQTLVEFLHVLLADLDELGQGLFIRLGLGAQDDPVGRAGERVFHVSLSFPG